MGDCITSYFTHRFVTEADCECRRCADDATTITEREAIETSYAAVCGAWQRTHECPATTCPDTQHTLLCVRGQCIQAPVAEAPEPSPCRTPADCPMHVYCVVNGLGGQIGCTNGACSLTSECVNGCATDADCPSVSPVCHGTTCGRAEPAP